MNFTLDLLIVRSPLKHSRGRQAYRTLLKRLARHGNRTLIPEKA